MSDDFPVTVYHNPACGTSRNTIALIRAAGIEPQVVEYLKVGWTRPLLDRLVAKTGLTPREIMRDRGSPAADLGLLETGASDEAILSAMVEHPILVNRPIVVTPKGAALCRPAERALELLKR
jgi:arsenate reductase